MNAPELLNKAASIMTERGKQCVTQELLKEIYEYSEATGLFIFKKTRGGVKRGSIAGSAIKSGESFYLRVNIGGVQLMAHRLAWLYVYGVFPVNEIDHIDGDSMNNRICNLREATRKQNNENVKLRTNNTSGYRGVAWSASAKKWRAMLQHNKKPIHVGYFSDANEASLAVTEMRSKLFSHYTQREMCKS